MEIIFSEQSLDDFIYLEWSIQRIFKKHFDKVSKMPPRRHLRAGLPWNVEEVTKQARLVYEVDLSNNKLYVVRCFATHKDYEQWYKSLR